MREEFLVALSGLRRATLHTGDAAHPRRAPYKPLTLLWAIGRLWRDPDAARLVPFDQVRQELSELIGQFRAGGNGPVNVINPLWRLQSDGDLWEVRTSRPPVIGADGIPTSGELQNTGAMCGLTEHAHQLLRDDVPLRLQAGQLLAEQVCPATIWDDLFAAVGIPYDGSPAPAVVPMSSTRTREMATRLSRCHRFRVEVMNAYDYRCAVCGASPRVGERRFGVEAAHIQWVTEAGPDEVCNGLALCVMHHRGLDRGAFTLDSERMVRVSPSLAQDAADQFWQFDGKPIARPARREHHPVDSYIDWHRREVFVAG
jgi:putative restriction endonuclease